MKPPEWADFSQIWVVDYEYQALPGENPTPICYCAREVISGASIKKWLDGSEQSPEYSTDGNSLFIAFYAPAEMGCHVALGWQRPRNIVDLYAEFRNISNGRSLPAGKGLLGACCYYGVQGGDATFKDTMRDRIMQGAPFTDAEKAQILEYCDLDVQLTQKLFLAMGNSIDLRRALLRGRYSWAVAVMENYGVPINREALDLLRVNWDTLKTKLIEKVDANYHVFDGTVFKTEKFLAYLSENNIPWETTPTGRPRLDEEFFKDQAKTFPVLKPLQELRFSLSQLKLNDLQVGNDNRNRAMLSPFGTVTGRNTPSSSKFIFGNAVWVRNLIRPEPGMALAYIDYSQQEIAIAAALSGDLSLKEAYLSGDTYTTFAKQAGAVPASATKESHPEIRDQFKTCMLGINYGMREESFARRVNIPLPKAKEIYRMHHAIYRTYWEWVRAFVDQGQLLGKVSTRFGWQMDTRSAKHGTLQNFPMQAHGADILRLAVCLCLENNIRVIAPVHDALLIEAPAGEIEKEAEKTQWIMSEASRYVIDFPIKTDVKIYRHPDHYTDKRGDVMWKAVWEVMNG